MSTAWSVLVAVVPLLVVFLVFQALVLRLPAREVARMLVALAFRSMNGMFLIPSLGVKFVSISILMVFVMFCLATAAARTKLGFSAAPRGMPIGNLAL